MQYIYVRLLSFFTNTSAYLVILENQIKQLRWPEEVDQRKRCNLKQKNQAFRFDSRYRCTKTIERLEDQFGESKDHFGALVAHHWGTTRLGYNKHEP